MGNSEIKTPDASGWFSVRDLGDGIFAIMEPHHFQEVISFLICGETHALLFDTGMGVLDIREVVSALTTLPIIAVNSHAHFDHVGGNYLFDEVYAFDNPRSIERLKAGYSMDILKGEAQRENFAVIPPDFDFDTYCIKPSRSVVPIRDGHVFSLGGRELRVLHTPGHSPDSIMLLLEGEGRLFTGDTYYPATLYAHILDPGIGNSNVKEYAECMNSLRPLVPKLKKLYTAHNDPEAPPEELLKVADALAAISEERGPAGVQIPDNNKYGFGLEAPPVFRYEFGNIVIVARKA